MKNLTCRDIIVSKLKELGADGLLNKGRGCSCVLRALINPCNLSMDTCIPVRIINGKWVAVEEKEYCEWYKHTDNYCYTWCGWRTYAIVLPNSCPYCGKTIREVKP